MTFKSFKGAGRRIGKGRNYGSGTLQTEGTGCEKLQRKGKTFIWGVQCNLVQWGPNSLDKKIKYIFLKVSKGEQR